jgi:hypothetical protein
MGNCLGIYSGVDDQLTNKIMILCSSPRLNENLVNSHIIKYDNMVDDETYKSPDEVCKLKGIVIRIYYHSCLAEIAGTYKDTYKKYFSTYFFSNIIHEATHARQICDIEKTLKTSKNVLPMPTKATMKNQEIRDERYFEGTELEVEKIKLIDDMHIQFSYYNTGYEIEARKEENIFIQSIIETKG